VVRGARGAALLLLSLAVLVSLSSAAAGYGERVFNANLQTSGLGYPIASGMRAAQSFLVADPFDLHNVTLFVNNTGLSQSDTLNVTIETDAAGDPSGVALANSQQARSGLGWLDFPFAPSVILQGQTTYWMVASSLQTAGDGYLWYHSAADAVPGEAKVDQGLGWIVPTPTDMTYTTYGILREPTLGLALQEPSTADPGANFSYSVLLNNTGSQIAPIAWLNMTLPSGIQYVSDTASGLGGTKTGDFNWTFANLTNGPHSFSIGVRVDELVSAGSTLAAQASLDYSNSTGAIKAVPPSSTRLIVGVKPRDLFLTYDGIPDLVDRLSTTRPMGVLADFDGDGQPGLTVAAETSLWNGPRWMLQSPLARRFRMTGPTSLTLYMDSALPNDTGDLGVALFDQGSPSTLVTATTINLTFNGVRDWEPFTIDLRSVYHSFDPGNKTELVLFNQGSHALFVAYNESSLPSRITVNTPSYVEFDSIRLTDARGSATYFSTADAVRIEANVSHPFGSVEITEIRVHLVDPEGAVAVASDSLSLTMTDPEYPSVWKLFTYTYQSPSKQGTYTFWLSAFDSNSDWAKETGSFQVRAPALNLTVFPPTAFRRALDPVVFAIYLNNTGQANGTAWLNVTLPSGLVYVSDSAAAIGGTRTGDYNWTFSNIPHGSHNLTLTTEVGAVPALNVLTALFDLRYADAKGFVWSAPTAQSRIVVGGARILPAVFLDKAVLHPTEPLAITVHFDNVGDGDSATAWINVTLGPNLGYSADDAIGFKNTTSDPVRFVLSSISPGSHSFTIWVNGSGSLMPGLSVAISAVVDYALAGPLTAHSVASATVSGSGPSFGPTLSGVSVANPGEIINVTLDYSNLGTEAAVGVLINLSFGSEATFRSASLLPTSVQGGSVAWSLPSVDVGSYSISVSVSLQVGLSDNSELRFVADVSFRDGWGNRLTSTSGTYSVRIGAPFLSLDLFSGFVTVEPGDSERVTVSYANLGIGTAAHVWINLTLPNEVVYLADDAGPAPAVLGSTWSWHVTSVSTGVRLFHVDLRIASWASDGRNIHLLAWLNGTDASGNRVNGSAGSIGFLVRTAAITVEAIVPIQEGIPGEDVVVTVFLNNTGSRTAVLVWLNLSYGSGLVFLGDTSGLPRQLITSSVSWLRLAMVASDRFVFTFILHITARPGDVASMSLEALYSNSKGVLVGSKRTSDFVVRAIEPPKGLLEQPLVLAAMIGVAISGAFGFRVWSSRRYRIEEVFLINRTGILLHHVSRREEIHGGTDGEKDRDLVGAMLTVVQQFVQDAFAYRENHVLKELEFGDYRLLIERGERVFLAVVFVGADNAHLRRWARRSLDEIEEEFDQTLAAWGGNMDDIVGVRSSLERHLVKAGGANSRVRRIAPQKV